MIPVLEDFAPEILQGSAENYFDPSEQVYKDSGSHHCLLHFLLYIEVKDMCGLI